MIVSGPLETSLYTMIRLSNFYIRYKNNSLPFDLFRFDVVTDKYSAQNYTNMRSCSRNLKLLLMFISIYIVLLFYATIGSEAINKLLFMPQPHLR